MHFKGFLLTQGINIYFCLPFLEGPHVKWRTIRRPIPDLQHQQHLSLRCNPYWKLLVAQQPVLGNCKPWHCVLVLNTRNCTWAIPVPSPLVLVWEKAVSLLFLNDIYFWISASNLLLLCPSSYFSKQRHRFPVRVKQEGRVSPAFQAPLCTAILGLLLFCHTAEKYQAFRGIPFWHFYYYHQKKSSDDVSA